MSPQSILIGQIIVVLATIIFTTWYATQWVALQFDYDAYLGNGLYSVGNHTIYSPWSLFLWWYQFDAYAPDIFAKGGQIAEEDREPVEYISVKFDGPELEKSFNATLFDREDRADLVWTRSKHNNDSDVNA